MKNRTRLIIRPENYYESRHFGPDSNPANRNPAKPTMASFELTGKQLLKQSAWKMERSAD
jgi:hypothetical protein